MTTAFTKFPLTANTPTKISGKSQEASFGSSGISAFASGDVSGEVTVDADNDITSVALNTATNGVMSWNGNNAEMDTQFGDRILTGVTTDGTRVIGVANPESADNNFEYQTYGAWMDEGAGKVGVFSVGSETAAANIPDSGTATFKGTAAGLYHDGVTDPQMMTANASLDVDFASQRAEFTTTGTVIETGANDNLNMTGHFYLDGSGSTITTADNSMTGTANGHLYGPGAEEIGGTFVLSGGGATMAGGYGAVQQ